MAKRRGPETALIATVTHDGKGIATIDGKKVFIAGALAGEEVRFQRRKVRRNYDEAELLEVLQPSADRIEPRCAAYGVCGGCSLQHVSIERQRQIKQQSLRESLERIGHVEPQEWLEPVTAESWGYRRRARLTVKDVQAKGRTLVGFRERHAPFVADMHHCDVLAEPVGSMLDELSALVGQLSIRARLPQIEVAVADNAVGLVIRVLDPPTADDLLLLGHFGEQHQVRIYLQPGGLDTITLFYPSEPQPSLHYKLPDFDVVLEFEPFDFVQINGPLNARMVALALEKMDLSPDDKVLDLFCGLGNFSLPIARKAGEVLGIEGAAELVDRARANAALNGISNARFITADLSQIHGNESWIKETWDTVLLDPARAGAIEVVSHMKALGPRRVVYVSCHPGTLARDANELVQNQGYRLVAAGILDMFPHTAHVESIAVFEKN